MKARRTAAGASNGTDSTHGRPPSDLNASNGVSNEFKRGPQPGLDRRQLAIVHVAANQLGLSEAEYRAVLQAAAGVDSSKDLTPAGFAAVMLAFERLGFTSHGTRRKTSTAEGMATPAQIAYIEAMWRRWHGRADAAGLRRWLHAKFHVSDLRFATVPTAQKAIEGLRAMLARQEQPRQQPSLKGFEQ